MLLDHVTYTHRLGFRRPASHFIPLIKDPLSGAMVLRYEDTQSAASGEDGGKGKKCLQSSPGHDCTAGAHNYIIWRCVEPGLRSSLISQMSNWLWVGKQCIRHYCCSNIGFCGKWSHRLSNPKPGSLLAGPISPTALPSVSFRLCPPISHPSSCRP